MSLHLSRHSCKSKTTSRTHNIRVKADPGADANLMPLHHFREIFPCVTRMANPKEGVLEKAESSFESYSGDNVTVIDRPRYMPEINRLSSS